jgi:hypothetical protein
MVVTITTALRFTDQGLEFLEGKDQSCKHICFRTHLFSQSVQKHAFGYNIVMCCILGIYALFTISYGLADTDGRVSLKEKEVIVHHKQDLGPILSVNAIVAASQMLANVTDVDYAGPYCLLCLPHLDSFALCQLPESSISIRLYGLNGM